MADEGKAGSDPADRPADRPGDRSVESPRAADKPSAAKPAAPAATSKPSLPATSGVRPAASDPLRELRRRLDNPFGVTAVAFLLGLLLFLPEIGRAHV